MAGSNENYPGVIGRPNFRGGGGGKFDEAVVQNRRALSNINKNILEAPRFPCALHKRTLSERNEVSIKIPPVHRPITRNFAAQIANKLQTETEVVQWAKKTTQLVQVTKEEDDMHIIDVEDDVPMFVHHTEAILDEIDMMEEVEMEDVDEDQVMDIDSCDKENPLAVVEYVDDIYKFYKKTEGSSCVPGDYMMQQKDLNERMRGILIDWLIEVHYKFELMDETLYLTVNLIDRYLALQPIARKKLQLVGITAMLLACKYEEVSVPVVDDLILISDRAYSRKEVLQMEKQMVNTLQFNLSIPTQYVFMRRFLKAAQSDKRLELMSFFIMDLCLVEYKMLKFPPSLLAAGAIYTAQCALRGFREWSKRNEWHTNYSEEQLLECSRLMVSFHQKAGTGKLTGVHRKYNTFKFGYVPETQPANFLL